MRSKLILTVVFLVLFVSISTSEEDDCFSYDSVQLSKLQLIYADAELGDDVKGDGSREHPFASLDQSHRVAIATNSSIALSKGTFISNRPLLLGNGVSLFGGFSGTPDWHRDPSYVTTITSAFSSGEDYPVISARFIITPTFIEDVTVVARDASGPCCSAKSGSSIGVFIARSPGLTLRRVIIKSGDGVNAPISTPKEYQLKKIAQSIQHTTIDDSERSKDGLSGNSARSLFTSVGYTVVEATSGENGYDKWTNQTSRAAIGGVGGVGGKSGGASICLYVVGDDETAPLLQWISFISGKGGSGSRGEDGQYSDHPQGGRGGKGGDGIAGPSFHLFSIGTPLNVMGKSLSSQSITSDAGYWKNNLVQKFSLQPYKSRDCSKIDGSLSRVIQLSKTEIIPPSLPKEPVIGLQPQTTDKTSSTASPMTSSTRAESVESSQSDDLTEVLVISGISVAIAIVIVAVIAYYSEKKFKELEVLQEQIV